MIKDFGLNDYNIFAGRELDIPEGLHASDFTTSFCASREELSDIYLTSSLFTRICITLEHPMYYSQYGNKVISVIYYKPRSNAVNIESWSGLNGHRSRFYVEELVETGKIKSIPLEGGDKEWRAIIESDPLKTYLETYRSEYLGQSSNYDGKSNPKVDFETKIELELSTLLKNIIE